MKVAILGAPGAKKSQMARAMVKELGPTWKVIDGYVEKLRRRTGLPLRDDADFPYILQIITERWKLEQEAERHGFNTITCGTIYETIIYASSRAGWLAVGEAAMVEDRIYSQAMMQMFGMIESRTFDYDAMFLLSSPSAKDWDAVVDAKLPEVLDGFFKYAVRPSGKTIHDKALDAVEFTRAIETQIAASTDESGV